MAGMTLNVAFVWRTLTLSLCLLATASSFLLPKNLPTALGCVGNLQLRPRQCTGRGIRFGSLALQSSDLASQPDPWSLIEEGIDVIPSDSTHDLGFSFTCSGLHFIYQLGVVKTLLDRGVIVPGTPMAGSSGGSIVVATTAAGLDPDDVFRMSREMFEKIDASGESGFGKFGEHLGGVLDKAFPVDAHKIVNAWDGGALIGVSTLSPTPTPLLVASFESRSSLIEAVLASCHIPFYTAVSPVQRLSSHDLHANDGFFARVGTLGAPASRARKSCIVSPFSAKLMSPKRIALRSRITQDKRPIIGHARSDPSLLITPQDARLVETLPSMMFPSQALEGMDQLYADGKQDAERWLESPGGIMFRDRSIVYPS